MGQEQSDSAIDGDAYTPRTIDGVDITEAMIDAGITAVYAWSDQTAKRGEDPGAQKVSALLEFVYPAMRRASPEPGLLSSEIRTELQARYSPWMLNQQSVVRHG